MSSEACVTYRLPSERVVIEIPDGPTVEVAPIHATSIYQAAVGLMGRLLNAEGPASFDARQRLCRFVVAEAQPTWDIADHRGAIPPTPEGMVRLPDAYLVAIVEGWTAPFVAVEPTSVADDILPEGPVRDEVKRRLRAVKAA